ALRGLAVALRGLIQDDLVSVALSGFACARNEPVGPEVPSVDRILRQLWPVALDNFLGDQRELPLLRRDGQKGLKRAPTIEDGDEVERDLALDLNLRLPRCQAELPVKEDERVDRVHLLKEVGSCREVLKHLDDVKDLARR